MPAASIARRLLLAARAHSPVEMWRTMVMKSPKLRRDPTNKDMVAFLERRYGQEPLLSDLTQIMARTLNALLGPDTADAKKTQGGSELLVDNSRVHDVAEALDPVDASNFEELWATALKASDAHMRARYRRVPLPDSGTPTAEPATAQDSPPAEPAAQDSPSGRDYTGELALVDNDPALWHEYVQFDEEHRAFWESVAEDPGQLLVVRLGQPGSVAQARKQSVEAEIGRSVDGLPVLVGKGKLRLPDGTEVPVAPRRQAPAPQPESRPDEPDGRPTELSPRPRPAPRPPEPPQAAVSGATLDRIREAREMMLELMSINLQSVQDATGVRFNPTQVRAAYDELDGVLSEHGEPGADMPASARDYGPDDDEAFRRLYLRIHRVLGARRELEAAGVNVVPLKFLAGYLADFTARRSASCDVLHRGPLMDMRSAGGDSVCNGCDGCNKAAKVAEGLLRKQAIQLSKGNMRATKAGTITIDPGFMNCPVVRAVIRDLDTKASDMEALRRRLDDMGMIVTQGNHGQGQVYCLVRTEGEGGAKTRMCQWFIDAHGADGKFKIECAKD